MSAQTSACTSQQPYTNGSKVSGGLGVEDLVKGKKYVAQWCRPKYSDEGVVFEHVTFTFVFLKTFYNKPTKGQPVIIRLKPEGESRGGIEAHALGLVAFDGWHVENELMEGADASSYMGKWNHSAKVTAA